MRLKHNKKRNTAFVYEALIRELTKAVVRKNKQRKNQIVSIIKEHFNNDTLLSRELSLYQAICESRDLNKETAERVIIESRISHRSLDKKALYREQSSLIKKINKTLSGNIFNNFVPNYRSIASAYSIFNSEIPPKDRVLLESKMAELMTLEESEKSSEEKRHIDNIVYKTFVKKFNSEYGETLLSEQKELLSRYITSFSDNGIELKIYMNEEIGRLKDVVSNAETNVHVSEDKDMKQKAEKVLELLQDFKNREIDDSMVEKTLKIQDLANELTEQ
tara:strand:+ start:449 stop:1276 length:828 start_codon:yes stop_codon:yes gene_type:complete